MTRSSKGEGLGDEDYLRRFAYNIDGRCRLTQQDWLPKVSKTWVGEVPARGGSIDKIY